MPLRQRVVVAVPNVAESRLLTSWLEAEGFETVQRSTAPTALDETVAQPFDLLIAEITFMAAGLRHAPRPRFAETPTVVIASRGDAPVLAALGPQVMSVERPLERGTLVCMATMALMEARGERRSPRRTVDPIDASVNGIRSRIIDVSREGVRLEMPRDRRISLANFVVRVPAVGVAVNVQRMWTRTPLPDEGISVMWCGAALSGNAPLADQGWRSFIETLPAPDSRSRGYSQSAAAVSDRR